MRVYDTKGKVERLNIQLHNVVFAYTSPLYYNMDRRLLIEGVDGVTVNEYLYLEGGHCSCFNFNETTWDAIVYTRDELLKLATAEHNKTHPFWIGVRNYFGK